MVNFVFRELEAHGLYRLSFRSEHNEMRSSQIEISDPERFFMWPRSRHTFIDSEHESLRIVFLAWRKSIWSLFRIWNDANRSTGRFLTKDAGRQNHGQE